jgi:hypothetical protein
MAFQIHGFYEWQSADSFSGMILSIAQCTAESLKGFVVDAVGALQVHPLDGLLEGVSDADISTKV